MYIATSIPPLHYTLYYYMARRRVRSLFRSGINTFVFGYIIIIIITSSCVHCSRSQVRRRCVRHSVRASDMATLSSACSSYVRQQPGQPLKTLNVTNAILRTDKGQASSYRPLCTGENYNILLCYYTYIMLVVLEHIIRKGNTYVIIIIPI